MRQTEVTTAALTIGALATAARAMLAAGQPDERTENVILLLDEIAAKVAVLTE